MVDVQPVSVVGAPVRRAAPVAATWLLLVAPVVALILAAYALAAAVAVIPLGDLTPLLVLVVSLLARRWEGVRTRLFDLAATLAGIAVFEWVLAYVYLLSVARVLAPSELERLGLFFIAYVVQSVVMIGLFTAACLLSRSGILRQRRDG